MLEDEIRFFHGWSWNFIVKLIGNLTMLLLKCKIFFLCLLDPRRIAQHARGRDARLQRGPRPEQQLRDRVEPRRVRGALPLPRRRNQNW